MARASHGKPVENGLVRYLSPSAIVKGDAASGGCLRRWWYRYVEGRPEPAGKSQTLGTKVHEQLEHTLSTGEDVLGPIARAGRRFLPDPKSVRLEIGIGDGTLTAAGIPVLGYVDVVNVGPAIDPEGEPCNDPPNTVEIIDWKTTNSFDWAKAGAQLADDIQMVTYGEWLARRMPLDWYRPSHVYLRTRGTPEACKRTTLIPRERLSRRWEQIETIARTIQSAAAESDAGKVDANLHACGSYGGCPHRGYCPGGSHNSLEKLFGKEAAMNLLDRLKPPAAAPDAGIQAQIAILAAEDAAAKEPPAPAAGGLGELAAFIDACGVINSAGKGFPTLTGAAADALSKARGWKIPSGTSHNGEGLLKALSLAEIDKVIQLAAELRALPPAPVVAAPPALLPPDAPASNPTLASVAPVVTADAPKKRGRPAKVAIPDAIVTYDPIATAPTVAPVAAPRGVRLFVDCIPDEPFTPLHSYVGNVCDVIAKQYGAADVRIAPKDGPLAFGQWKGAVAALARQSPPPPGTYVLDARGNEIAEIVADALRGSCEIYARGR